MAAGCVDNEPVGLDWKCRSITFNNVYIVFGEGGVEVACLCRGVAS